MIIFSPTMSIKFLPGLHITVFCIKDHTTNSDWVMISFSYKAFTLVNLRGLLHSHSLTII